MAAAGPFAEGPSPNPVLLQAELPAVEGLRRQQALATARSRTTTTLRVEADDSLHDLPGGHGIECLVDLLQPDDAAHHLVEFEPADQVQVDEPRDIDRRRADP